MKASHGIALGLVILAFCTSGSMAAGDPASSSSGLLSQIRQLTYEGRRSGEGYFSPDGQSLIFQSEREPGNPFYQIYLLDLRNGDTHRVSPGMGKTTCSFFRPGSRTVLFASTHLDLDAEKKQRQETEFRASGKARRYSWDYDEQMDIFSANQDGTGLRRLTDAYGYDAEGAYSPDGRKIVFCSLRNAYPPARLSAEEQKRLERDPSYFGEIYIMNADGSNQKRLTSQPGYDGGPFFSPDGQKIVWRRFNQNGTIADIYTMRPDGTEVRRLTRFESMSWAPFFHPSGRYLIFTSNKLGFSNFELFLVDAEGIHEPVRVTYSNGFDGLPVFSPDGGTLCWTSNRNSEKQSQLYLAKWDHAKALKVLGEAAIRQPKIRTAKRPSGIRDAEFSPRITKEDLRRRVEFLASEKLEGRRTGSPGARMAGDFIAETFARIGLQPLGKNGSYFQPFQFTSKIKTARAGNALEVREGDGPGRSYGVDRDFRPLAFSATGSFEGSVVFAGYGLWAPGGSGEADNSYADLNVSNKVVLVLRYVPEEVEPKRRQELNRYAGLRYKAMIAREHGARGLLVVTGPNSPNAGKLVRHTFDTSLSGSEILAASVTAEVAETILSAAGKGLKALQSGLDRENPHAVHGFDLAGVRVRLATAVDQIKSTGRNVVGYLPGRSKAGVSEQYLLLGAHYDHLGRGGSRSLQRKGEEGQIHFGADDNASGTAAVLELAESLSSRDTGQDSPPGRGVIFALWSGEEIGLIGSSRFAEHPLVSLSNVVGYLNFDMVGRLRENKLTLQGVGSSSDWKRLIERGNVVAGFDLNLQADPYLPTDTTPFYQHRIPVLSFFTGSHEDYHRPTDTPDKIDYEGLVRIVQFARTLVLDLAAGAEPVEYAKVTRSASKSGSRDRLRVYLGTIPDYTSEVRGVKLSGVAGGGPADQAGVESGDVIVELAGQKIANIYDYTYAIDALKIGKPVPLVVLRNQKRLTLKIVPQARE